MLYEPIDGDKSEPIDCQFFDVSHLLSLPVDFVESHRLSIIFCFVNGISVSQFQSDIKLTVPEDYLIISAAIRAAIEDRREEQL